MSGPTLEDQVQARIGQAGPTLGDIPVEEAAPQPARRSFDFSFLKAQTGDGPVENYLDHALNFNNSRSLARILRGLTGIIGELNLAVIDIGMGLVELMKHKPKPVNPSVGMVTKYD